MGDSPKWVKSKKRRKTGGRDRTLAIKAEKTSEKSPFFLKKIKFTQKNIYFLHISTSYAKILGGKLFRTREFPQSRRKAKKGERKRPKIILFCYAVLSSPVLVCTVLYSPCCGGLASPAYYVPCLDPINQFVLYCALTIIA